jgi:prepilin-type N-terminal cleavage/methylation domain-containing protein
MRKQEKGFTVIEVVVSLFIFGVMLMVYIASANTVILNRNSKHKQTAYRVAAGAIEQLRATPYASLPNSGSINDPLLSELPTGQGTLSISPYNAKTKQVTSTVTWRNPGNNSLRSFSLTTLITEGGIGR